MQSAVGKITISIRSNGSVHVITRVFLMIMKNATKNNDESHPTSFLHIGRHMEGQYKTPYVFLE